MATLQESIKELINELNTENDKHFQENERHCQAIYEIGKKIEELLARIDKSCNGSSAFDNEMFGKDITFKYQKIDEIDSGILKGGLQEIKEESKGCSLIKDIDGEKTKDVPDGRTISKKEELKVQEKIKGKFLFPDKIYEEYIGDFKDNFRSFYKLELNNKLKDSLGFIIDYKKWQNEKELREEVTLVEASGPCRYYAKKEILNGEGYYLLGYYQKSAFIDEIDVIKYAIDIFFDIDVEKAINGTPMSMERPAVLVKDSDGVYKLKEKGKLRIGR